MHEPNWMLLARSFLGVAEVPGVMHNAKIVGFWKSIRSVVRDDETPWCAAFVGAMLEQVGLRSTRSPAARSYLQWGVDVKRPTPGCVVVFSRPGAPWSGHVGFFVGFDQRGNVLVLGGNQGDRVSIAPFAVSRVLSYRVPLGHTVDRFGDLPVLDNRDPLSVNEA